MKVEVGKKMASQESVGVPDATSDGGGEGEGGGKTVVVGVRMDARSNELLTWALVKVAQPGDRVVALHVLPNSAPSAADAGPVEAFDSVLAVYEGFCHLKQVDLKLKVCRGSSLRKVLVREAAAVGAASLILGVNHSTHRIGSSSISIAKYCAKKLPNACSVVAVSNGKVVFQRDAAQADTKKCLLRKGHRTKSKDKQPPTTTDIQNWSNDNLFCLLPDRGSSASGRMDAGEGKLPLPSVELEKICSICTAVISEPCKSDLKEVEDNNSESLSPVSALDIGSIPGSPPPTTQEGQQQQARWPALRKLDAHKRKPSFSDRTKASIAQWVTRLPGRHSMAAASIHPDQKLASPDTNADDSDAGCEDDFSGAKIFDSVDLSMFSEDLESVRENYASKCRVFTFDELSTATFHFADENLIGKGGNSYVYKGCLSDGRELAVKVLKPSAEIVKEFILEIEIITTVHHKNITSLVGFCFEDNNLILVYDFLSRGSLERSLEGLDDKNKNVLSWDRRYKVAIGVAKALDHLHSGGDIAQPVIHRDVKSSNILLSEDFEPQLSDFGLATWASSSSTSMPCNDVAGTFGYLAPEYFTIGKVNEKIDVYAFGVVLLELLTGRKPITKVSTKGQESLVLWAKPILQSGKTSQMLDPSLGDNVRSDQVERFVLAASLCTKRAPKLRPKMAQVLKLLQGDEEATESARCLVNTSEDVEEPEDDDGDGETSYPDITDIQSHLSLALLDVEDEELSSLSADSSSLMVQSSVEAYLQGRWSRSWSFE